MWYKGIHGGIHSLAFGQMLSKFGATKNAAEPSANGERKLRYKRAPVQKGSLKRLQRSDMIVARALADEESRPPLVEQQHAGHGS
jgi:hypothetical protein